MAVLGAHLPFLGTHPFGGRHRCSVLSGVPQNSQAGGRENLATTLSLLAIVLLFVLPATWVVWTISNEAAQLLGALKDKSDNNGGWGEWLIEATRGPLLRLGLDPETIRGQVYAFVVERAESASTATIRVVQSVLGNVASFLVNAVICLFVLYFLLRDGDHLMTAARGFLPLDEEVFDRLVREVGESVLANIYGIGAVALVQGTATGLLFFFVGLPSPVLWGTMAGLLSVVPILGPPVVWIPAAISLAATGQWVKALIVAGAGAGIVGSLDNVVRPWIISGRVRMHPLLIFIALLGGTTAFGLLGLFIGPAILSAALVAFEALKWGVRGKGVVEQGSAET
jgi:predicted PurR-regulated permease PerM